MNIKIKLNGKENSYYHRILEKLLHSLVPGSQFDLVGKKNGLSSSVNFNHVDLYCRKEEKKNVSNFSTACSKTLHALQESSRPTLEIGLSPFAYSQPPAKTIMDSSRSSGSVCGSGLSYCSLFLTLQCACSLETR